MNGFNRYVVFSLIGFFFSVFLLIAHVNAKSLHNVIHFDPEISNPYVEYESDSEMLVNIKLWGDRVAPRHRPPVNLVLVIDESGSMSGKGKMTYAKKAAKDLISKLNRADRLAIVSYSDESRLVMSLQKLHNKSRAKKLIDSIHPTNSTNLSSGLLLGIEQLKYRERDGYINKIILLSDGLANRGITDINALSRISNNAANHSIYVTTMGLGLEYDEDLLMSISDYGAGNYYFIESPNQIAYIFDKEFGQMLTTIARDIEVELDFAPGVDLIELYGYKYEFRDNKIVLNPGTVFSGQNRNIKLRMKIPTEKKGLNNLMTASLNYSDANGIKQQEIRNNINYRVTENKTKVSKYENKEVAAQMVSVNAARSLEDATKDYEDGNKQRALSRLKSAIADVKEVNKSKYRLPSTVQQEKVLNEALDSMSAPEEDLGTSGRERIIKTYKAESRAQQK